MGRILLLFVIGENFGFITVHRLGCITVDRRGFIAVDGLGLNTVRRLSGYCGFGSGSLRLDKIRLIPVRRWSLLLLCRRRLSEIGIVTFASRLGSVFVLMFPLGVCFENCHQGCFVLSERLPHRRFGRGAVAERFHRRIARRLFS